MCQLNNTSILSRHNEVSTFDLENIHFQCLFKGWRNELTHFITDITYYKGIKVDVVFGINYRTQGKRIGEWKIKGPVVAAVVAVLLVCKRAIIVKHREHMIYNLLLQCITILLLHSFVNPHHMRLRYLFYCFLK